jgi:dolichyl-phosphate beta-glucosyltransferase
MSLYLLLICLILSPDSIYSTTTTDTISTTTSTSTDNYIFCPRFSATIVVPCYNEERRLPSEVFLNYVKQQSTCSKSITFLLVNDGSTDNTLDVLKSLEMKYPSSFQVLNMEQNVGKAEAVRHGLIQAMINEPPNSGGIVGYWDGDLATPLTSVDVFMNIFHKFSQIQMVFGSRVALLGRDIQRHASRHYLGRIFATLASLILELRIYDTQCGAKLFRSTNDMKLALTQKFQSRWIFDVELIARLKVQRQHSINNEDGGDVYLPLSKTIYESPLDSWRDISGSKLSFRSKTSALYGLFFIWKKYKSPLRNWNPSFTSGGEIHMNVDDEEGDILFYGIIFVLLNSSVVLMWCCCLVFFGKSSKSNRKKKLERPIAKKKKNA